jgi:hypothetical protein
VAKAGWYNDEVDGSLARWFDGEVWTEHVTEKAYWESVGQEPPPPYELLPAGPGAAGARRRAWMAVGSAAVVGALAIAGVALAQDDGGGKPDPAPTARRSDATSRTTDALAGTDDLGAATSVDPVFGTDVENSGGAVAVGGRSSSATTAKAGSKTKTTTSRSGGVTRTETRTESHTSPNITSSPQGGDKSSVGNSTNTTITSKTTITSPPSTSPPSTDPSSPTSEAPPPSTDGGSGP